MKAGLGGSFQAFEAARREDGRQASAAGRAAGRPRVGPAGHVDVGLHQHAAEHAVVRRGDPPAGLRTVRPVDLDAHTELAVEVVLAADA